MKHIFSFLIIFAIILAASEINCEKKDQAQARKSFVKRRNFGFYEKFRLDELLNKYPQFYALYELYQRLLKVIEDKETQRKNEEHETRRKIFQKYLLKLQNGSSFLRDFHTIRF